MSDKTLTVDKEDLKEFIADAIKTNVNGKLDKVYEHLKKQDKVIAQNQKAVTKHIETLKPYIEGADFLQKAYRYTRWAYPTVIAAVAAYYTFKAFITTHLGI